MLDLNDDKWKHFEGGYRMVYDASKALKQMKDSSDPIEIKIIYDEFYQDLHHQGDVGLASYYAVPHLISLATDKQMLKADFMALVITIETARQKNNPPIPSDLQSDYEQALVQLGELGKSLIIQEWDLSIAATALAAIAISKAQIDLAKAITILEDDGTLEEFLENY